MRKYLETKVEDVDEKGQVIVAANAIGNIDADKDISMQGSFTKTLKENFNRVRWFLNHNKEILLGVPIKGWEEMPYLKMHGQLNMKKEIARDTYEDYKLYAEHGRSLEHSIGVDAVKKQQEKDVRKVFEWKLWEYSTLTSWGANDQTPMLGIKSIKDLQDEIDWLEIKMRKGNFTDDRFKEIEKHLQILRSLSTEPDTATHVVKPNEKQGTLNQAALLKLNSITQLFK
jgi:HK97 family phage prohead protease